MAIDREASLKNAEKFLRVGRLDAAIGEYARVAEDQPKDWNTANALGDLYVRAGQPDKAVTLYRRIAEHLLAEGFYPKAGALFKKILKSSPDDEPSQVRLGEISATQGLMADAKAYYSAIATRRRQRGDTTGADEIVIRLGTLDPDDLDARRAGAQAAERNGDAAAAARQYRELYDAFLEEGRPEDAAGILKDCVRCNPGANDPGLLLPLAGLALREGRLDDARTLLSQLPAAGPTGRDGIVDLAWKLVESHPASAAVCVDVAADAFVAASDFAEAATLLQAFTTRVPGQIPALLRLVEVCVDGSLEGTVYEAQALLADAYLAEGRADEARVIAEDLVSRDPSHAGHTGRLRRALEILNVDDIEAEIAARVAPAARESFDTFADRDVLDDDPVQEAPVAPVPSQTAGTAPTPPVLAPTPSVPRARVDPAESAPDRLGESKPLANVEVDLTSLLGELEKQAATPMPGPRAPANLDAVFAGMRTDTGDCSATDESGDYFSLARTYLEMGLPQEAIASLEIAARSPHYRFAASSMLAQIYRDASELAPAIEWLERAAEVSPPGPDEGRALLYDLADVLETVGEPARALAVFLELQADAPGYHDVADRVSRLSRAETEG